MDKPTITLAGKEIVIGKPRPSFIAPVGVLASHNETIAQAAALGLCWEFGTEPRKPADYRKHRSNPQTYGEAVIDELTERGAPLPHIIAAGRECLSWLISMTITATEVEVAETVGNSVEKSASTP